MEILRNMWRRKFRSLLTVLGIAIGIFAFTVMGSMALKINRMIKGGKDYITGQITVVPKGTNFMSGGGTATLPLNTLNEIAKVDGVSAVAPMVELALEEPDPDNPTGGGFSMGPPPTIEGFDLASTFENRNWKTLDMQSGHMPTAADGDRAVAVGSSIAADKKLTVGDTMTIRGRDFTVVGVLAKTMTGPDSYVFMSITPAREMLIAANPFLKSLKEQSDQAATISDAALATLPPENRAQIQQARTFKTEDVTTMASVSWKDDFDSEEVASRIKEQFKDEAVILSPKKMGEEIDKASAIFYSIILGSALLALLVGGFSIINTMVMAISERTKEIGVKKAIGASRGSIAREYTVEAGVIGLIGGILGTGLGLLMVTTINRRMAAQGAEIFLVDWWYVLGTIIFAFFLGILAGVLPAWRASRLRVVEALREL